MSSSTSRIQRAILSVTDKTGLADFARQLSALDIELISTGGTAKLLRDSGIAVKDISELTGFPEMLDGRVKTLHPKVHGGILHRRENPTHIAAVAEHGILPIDMIVVNLYAFEKTASKPGVAFEELIENIDIGGPSMIRSAAKNFYNVAVVTSPADYPAIAEELVRIQRHAVARNKMASRAESFRHYGRLRFRHRLHARAHSPGHAAIFNASANSRGGCARMIGTFPQTLRLSFQKILDLRYGENPHQKAAMYSDGSASAWLTPANFRARSFPTTTSSTCRPRGISRRNSIRTMPPSAPSSSTPILPAPLPAKLWPKPTSGPLNAIPFRRSAA